MKKILIIVYSAFVIIMLVNYFYYKSLYAKQINYIFELLDRQVQIVGLQVDETNNGFLSDLNQINFSEDLSLFFEKTENNRRAVDRMKLFFSKYDEFITGIKFYDNKRNEFTLKKDSESETGEWLEQSFVLHVQDDIFDMERLMLENRRFNYYLPVYDQNSVTVGNIVVTVDFQKYFREIFTTFNLQDYQWQWVVSDSGEIIYDNFGKEISYSGLDKIVSRLAEGSVENTVHSASIDGKRTEIISSYYSTHLLQRDFGLIFSAPTAFFQKYIIRNSLFIVLGTLLMVQLIIFFLWKYIRSLKSEKKKLKASEKMLGRFFDEIPVGVIIYRNDGEIIKANKTAAGYYSLDDETELLGKSFHSHYPGAGISDAEPLFNDERFIVIQRPEGELILFRKSIPFVYKGSEVVLEILMDVTLLESARRQEARKNDAKSEFLSRISYEMRTPLNGIVSMTDVLNRQEVEDDKKEVIRLLRRSSEVLMNIVDNILDFSRIETGDLVINEIPFNLREEVEYCLDVLRANISSDRVAITSHMDENIPSEVIGDPYRLRQVLTNLLNNSLKNTQSGRIDLGCHLKKRMDKTLTISFELSDTGISYDKTVLQKMFDRDLDPDQNINPTFGTILAKQLVQLMGGELTAYSPSGLEENKGLKVVFSIDVYSAEKIRKDLPVEKIRTMDGITALVITGTNRDEESIGLLHQLGLSITVTTFMNLTVNQIKSNLDNPDKRYSLIVITDDENFDGFSAARALYDNNLAHHFIIMVISSNDRKGNYLKAGNLGVDYYLTKPLDYSELAGRIRESFPFAGDTYLPGIPGNGRNLNILFVEDNKMNQLAIGTMLKNLGYTFDLSEDGYSAYLQARAKKYDLILMDLFLPEIDGFEAAQKILKSDGSTVIIALTADNLPDTRKKAELAGFKDFIIKPVKQDDLKKMFLRHFK